MLSEVRGADPLERADSDTELPTKGEFIHFKRRWVSEHRSERKANTFHSSLVQLSLLPSSITILVAVNLPL